MSGPSSPGFVRMLRRMRRFAVKAGLSPAEVERMLSDARQGFARAVAAGLHPRDVRVLLSTDGAGSLALFVGDAESVQAASAERELRARAGVVLH